MRSLFVVVLGFMSTGLAHAQEVPAGKTTLSPVRWRAVRQVLQIGAEQAGYRWAMPATISRRSFQGSAEATSLPAKDIVSDLCKHTGLTAEMLNGILVVHEPNPTRLNERIKQAGGKDRPAALAAICELGWLRDARSFPALAQIAIGDDVELALAAAQALRRLDGEKALDWRLHGVSNEDPEFPDIVEPVAPWQAPLGLAFPGCVSKKDVERLAGSSYLPLREAAARLSPALGADGQGLNDKLASDPSLLVRTAAERTAQAWAKAQTVQKPFIRKARRMAASHGGNYQRPICKRPLRN